MQKIQLRQFANVSPDGVVIMLSIASITRYLSKSSFREFLRNVKNKSYN